MANEVEICNLALSRVSSFSIQSLNDQTKEARECKRLYPFLRDSVLRAHDWSFARKRQILAMLSETYSGWDITYQMPGDCLNPREIFNDIEYPAKPAEKIAYEIGVSASLDKRIILCDKENAELIYTARVTDCNLFDAIFIDAFAWRLASELAQSLKSKQSLQESSLKKYAMILADAQAESSNEGYVEPTNQNSFTRART